MKDLVARTATFKPTASSAPSIARARLGLDRGVLKVFVLLLFTVALSYFVLFRSFGLYSDDYTFISRPFGWTAARLLEHIRWAFTDWPIGRPVGFVLPQIFAFSAAHLGGLPMVYVFSLLILTANAFLVYLIGMRVGSEVFAVTAALAYALFPADTTRPFAMHATGLQTSMTFLLIATLLYLSGRRWLAFPVAALSLLTYESAFMPFLAVPLLLPKWDRRLLRDWLVHLGVCVALILAAFLYRSHYQDIRAVSVAAEPAEMIMRALGSLVMGPSVALSTFGFRWLTPWQSVDRSLVAIMGLAFVVFVWRLSRLRPDYPPHPEYPAALESAQVSIQFSPKFRETLSKTHPNLLVAGLVALAFGYGLSFTHFPPLTIAGQETSVHLAATFGAALVFGWVCSAVWSLLPSRRFRLALVVLLSLYLASLVGFGFVIQRDYRTAWNIQKWFWQGAIKQLPDLQDGTIILAVQDGIPKTRFINALSWADPLILPEIYTFPNSWSRAPQVYPVPRDWAERATVTDDKVLLDLPAWLNGTIALPPANLIVLESKDGALVRDTGTVTIQGHPFALKPLGDDTVKTLPRGVLWRFLIGAPN